MAFSLREIGRCWLYSHIAAKGYCPEMFSFQLQYSIQSRYLHTHTHTHDSSISQLSTLTSLRDLSSNGSTCSGAVCKEIENREGKER